MAQLADLTSSVNFPNIPLLLTRRNPATTEDSTADATAANPTNINDTGLPTFAHDNGIRAPEGFWEFWNDYYSRDIEGRKQFKENTLADKWYKWTALLYYILLVRGSITGNTNE